MKQQNLLFRELFVISYKSHPNLHDLYSHDKSCRSPAFWTRGTQEGKACLHGCRTGSVDFCGLRTINHLNQSLISASSATILLKEVLAHDQQKFSKSLLSPSIRTSRYFEWFKPCLKSFQRVKFPSSTWFWAAEKRHFHTPSEQLRNLQAGFLKPSLSTRVSTPEHPLNTSVSQNAP